MQFQWNSPQTSTDKWSRHSINRRFPGSFHPKNLCCHFKDLLCYSYTSYNLDSNASWNLSHAALWCRRARREQEATATETWQRAARLDRVGWDWCKFIKINLMIVCLNKNKPQRNNNSGFISREVQNRRQLASQRDLLMLNHLNCLQPLISLSLLKVRDCLQLNPKKLHQVIQTLRLRWSMSLVFSILVGTPSILQQNLDLPKKLLKLANHWNRNESTIIQQGLLKQHMIEQVVQKLTNWMVFRKNVWWVWWPRIHAIESSWINSAYLFFECSKKEQYTVEKVFQFNNLA